MAARYAALACNWDVHLLQASLPLWETGEVDALEWAFDTLFQYESFPDWFDELLRTYGEAGRLVGHGVFFSLFSGRWSSEQQAWLNQLRTLAGRYRFDHVTEHFGFMTGADFHKGAPLSVPLTATTLAIGQDRLRRIQDAASCPAGLENLAFAYSLEEVKRQGDYLHRLVEPVNGFLILDLHNLYCQHHNFKVSFEDLLALYPLDRVREIHLSGGSWEPSAIEPGRTIRRDTHDDRVPARLFDWLETAIDRCPTIKYIVLEQIGGSLETVEAQAGFAADFRRLNAIVQGTNKTADFAGHPTCLPDSSILTQKPPLEDQSLYEQQRALAAILETATDCQHARALLATSNLANSAWEVESWQPAMLETAIAIAQKWRNGFDD
ncbi:DUF692 family multinuclear iron-containing protein [Larkinella sp. VNQ87]|uniref:multinuclear nonheme iron-dependent oxidase n=1 Tax=Larkinella sp. VNQ87 TaxID=3400921 RepID=UPI003C026FFA